MTIRDIVVAFGFDVDRNSEREAQGSIKGIANLAKVFWVPLASGFPLPASPVWRKLLRTWKRWTVSFPRCSQAWRKRRKADLRQ